MNRCTVRITNVPEPVLCGKPAVTSFTSRMSGVTYFECAEHAPHASTATAAVVSERFNTRSESPFLLVVEGTKVVGYALSNGPAVLKRARKLGAEVVPNPNAYLKWRS